MIFDVSGIHGAPGASGTDHGHTITLDGYDGSSGGHGETGQRGTSAGTIAMQLTTPISKWTCEASEASEQSHIIFGFV